MSILTFSGRVRGQSGASAPVSPTCLPYADAWRLRRVDRLLSLLQEHIHCPHCLDELVEGIIERGDGLTGLERLARRVAGEVRQ